MSGRRNITKNDVVEAEKAAKIRLASDEVQEVLVGHQSSDMRGEIEQAARRLNSVAPLSTDHAAYLLLLEARNAEQAGAFATSETSLAISLLAEALGVRAEYDTAKKSHKPVEPQHLFDEAQIRDTGELTAKVLLSKLPEMGDGHVVAELEICARNTAEQVIARTRPLTAGSIATTMAERAKHYSRSHDLADPQQARNLREIDMAYNAFADALGIKSLYLKAKTDLSRTSTPGDNRPSF